MGLNQARPRREMAFIATSDAAAECDRSLENPHIGIFISDFTGDLTGLLVNGNAAILARLTVRVPATRAAWMP
jgi:hypothetical protein